MSDPAVSAIEHDHEHALLAEHVAEAAEHRRRHRRAQQVGGEDPRDGALRRVQRGLQRRQRRHDERLQQHIGHRARCRARRRSCSRSGGASRRGRSRLHPGDRCRALVDRGRGRCPLAGRSGRGLAPARAAPSGRARPRAGSGSAAAAGSATRTGSRRRRSRARQVAPENIRQAHCRPDRRARPTPSGTQDPGDQRDREQRPGRVADALVVGAGRRPGVWFTAGCSP